MFGRKTSKREKQSTSLIIVHKVSNRERPPYQEQDYIESVSIDPGIANFALYIERRYRNGLITTIELSNTRFNYDEENNITNLYDVIKRHLDEFIHIYQRCHYIVIEKQMTWNHNSLRVMQFAITYFMFTCRQNPNVPLLIELDSRVKTKAFGAKMRDADLKKWSPIKAQELLRSRKDYYGLDILLNYPTKKDDMADAIIQLEAFFIMYGEQETRELEREEYERLYGEALKNEDSIPPVFIDQYLIS